VRGFVRAGRRFRGERGLLLFSVLGALPAHRHGALPLVNRLDALSHCSRSTVVVRRPVTILVGHFGAGKTEIAINLAFGLRDEGTPVTLVDLDVVKPYFRSRSAIDALAARGVGLVAPPGDLRHADLPIVVPEVRGAVGRAVAGELQVIIDVGGAEVGARVLGSIPALDDPAVTDTLFVVNGRRPFAGDRDEVLRMIHEIQQASRLQVSGLVSNTHLMDETTIDIVREGFDLAAAVSAASGVPIRCHAVPAGLAAAAAAELVDGTPLLCIDRHIMRPLDLGHPGTRRRSSIL